MVRELLLAATLFLAALPTGSVARSLARNGTFKLLVLHNNDMHGMFDETSQDSNECTPEERDADKCYGGIPRIAYVAKKERHAAEADGIPVLLLNAGDTYTGSSWFDLYTWRVAAEFVNVLEFDAISLGNHEFDRGEENLSNFISNLRMPVLAANLDISKSNEMSSLQNLYTSIIIEKNGVKIGIIGYITPLTKSSTLHTDVEFEDEVDAIRREAAKLKSQGVQIFIALGHSGYIREQEIARQVEDLDLVVGGHSHTLLSNNKTLSQMPPIEGDYPTIIKQTNGRTVCVVQAYAFTKYFGKLIATFDAQYEIINCSGDPILLDKNIPKDTEVLNINKRYRTDEKIIAYNRVVGTTLTFLDNSRCRVSECNIGNFVADSMLNYTQEKYPEANIAVLNAGSIRKSMQAGKTNLTYRDIKGDILPYPATLKLLTMSGTVLKQSLEHAVSRWTANDPRGMYMHFSGMNVTYDLSKPVGSRVVKALAVCSSCGKKMSPIQDSYEYKVIATSFMSGGGDGYVMYSGLQHIDLRFTQFDCVLDYLKRYSPINPQLDGRVTNLNEDKLTQN